MSVTLSSSSSSSSPQKYREEEVEDMDCDEGPPTLEAEAPLEAAASSVTLSEATTPLSAAVSLLSSPGTPITPTGTSKKRKRLTPDERLVREKERSEKRQKLEEEKQRKDEDKRRRETERLEKLKLKEQERLERERQRETERLKREEVKEQERVKKEEENAKRAEDKQKKEEERLKKEEERLKKEEDRKKKEEERVKQLEEKEKERLKLEEKQNKQKEHFTKFFQKSPALTSKVRTLEQSFRQSASADAESDKENKVDSNIDPSVTAAGGESSLPIVHDEVMENIDESAELQVVLIRKPEAKPFSPMPFQIKTHMAVATILRREKLNQEERSRVEKLFEENEGDCQSCHSDFFEKLRRGEGRVGSRTVVKYEDEEPEVRIMMEDVLHTSREGYRRTRMKLLQFHDNRRPAYWGTWKKKGTQITGRHPFGKEEELDYDFDSDDEWEDEPEDAEEIENSEGEEEPQDPAEGEPVDEEDEEGWMVPHGYLSDEEREGEEAEDIEIIKDKEKEFYKSLKEQVKLGLPLIQTESLSEYRIIFPINLKFEVY